MNSTSPTKCLLTERFVSSPRRFDYFCNISNLYTFFDFHLIILIPWTANSNSSVLSEMDSDVVRNLRLVDLVDDAWREDDLPFDDILVPVEELPDPEADSADSHLTLKEQSQKWQDVVPNFLAETSGNPNN